MRISDLSDLELAGLFAVTTVAVEKLGILEEMYPCFVGARNRCIHEVVARGRGTHAIDLPLFGLITMGPTLRKAFAMVALGLCSDLKRAGFVSAAQVVIEAEREVKTFVPPAVSQCSGRENQLH